MIYTVVCTDINDYVNWQFELLEYSWSRINQPGALVRLVSCEDDVTLPEHRHARVFRTRPSNVHPHSGDFYVCYNRLYSLKQWLDEEAIDGTLLIVDADVVFRIPISDEVSKGRPLGQHWIDFGFQDDFRTAMENSSAVDLDTLQPVTWPAMIDADDLRRLLPRWIEITVSVREQIKRQESDMFAFVVAARELNIEFELGTTTAFMPWPDNEVEDAPLIHYCQVVEGEDGEALWGKQSYQPWERVKGAETADLVYCRNLLHLVDEFARLKNFEPRHQTDTIFIAIASYCEPELVDTINSCLNKARKPENLRFGICHQFDDTDERTNEFCLDLFSEDIRFRYVIYNFRDSKGGCWARNIAQQLYQDEAYTLQIDAHTTMIESWDTLLIEMLESMPGEKPLISQFPPLYTVDGNSQNFQLIEDLSQVNTAIVTGWAEEGYLHHTQKLIPHNNHFPRRTRVISGALVFTTGEWNTVVMQDPDHFYTGEEFALTIRSFTHGYDLFDPNQIVAWHRLHPYNNRKFWDDSPEDISKFRHDQAIRRLQLLIDGDPDEELGRFGLGSNRSLEDFNTFSGIDCVSRSVNADAVAGNRPGPAIIQSMTDTDVNQDHRETVDSFIDVTIHLENMAPLLLICEERTPVLMTLFERLRQRKSHPDNVIYLNLGADGQEKIYFKLSQLVSIETSPPLSEEFFNKLEALRTEQQGNNTHQPATGFGEITDDWKIWIWHNVSRGCSKDNIFKQLVEHGFSWDAVRFELNHQPDIPLDEISVYTGKTAEEYYPGPVARRINIHGLEIYTVDNFLNPTECAMLRDIIQSGLQASTTVDDALSSGSRTSQTCFFDLEDQGCAVVIEVSSRLSRLIGINPDYAEPIQGHVYNPGEEYKAHHDWFEPGTPVFQAQANEAAGGQRTWSAVVYLNDVEEGGDTEFEETDLIIEPVMGKMVFWNNIGLDGMPNRNALHHACPVIRGQKFVLTTWYRTFGHGPMYIREPHEIIPRYTEKGFKLGKIPAGLFDNLSAHYRNHSEKIVQDEYVEGEYLQNESGETPSSLMEIPDSLQQRIASDLLPICEKWCQCPLKLSSIYGIRNYSRGTSLRMHTDTGTTHIISAILNIAQHVDSDWPLQLDDHMFRRHSILMAEGDMLFYEGGRLSHGRPNPLDGDTYANVFVHFCPLDYQPGESDT